MLSRITQYFGFDIDILKKLDTSSRIRIFISGLTGILVACLSAFFGAATFSELCFDGQYFGPIFVGWLAVMLFVEVIILGSNLDNRGVLATRIAACLLLGSFHCLAVDQFVFKDSYYYPPEAEL